MWEWARSKFDTLVLIAVFVLLFHIGSARDEAHEVLGALLLILTGTRSTPNKTP